MAEKVNPLEQGAMTTPGSSKNYLNPDVEIKGNIKFSGELTFDGRLEGDVQTDGILHVGENANINGNISAQNILARGKINGNIVAKDKVEIKARSEVFGEVRAAKLIIEEGVTFVGKIEVNPNKVAPNTPGQLPKPGDAPRPAEPPKPAGR
jgi:cytoskeletal protein CcmA (bactofilin family)